MKPIVHCNAKLLALGPTQIFMLGGSANAKICFGDTKILVSKNTIICLTPNEKHKICVTSNAKPQCEPMEYRLRWVPNAKFLHWACTFHVCVNFICVGYANTVFSGIRA